MKNVVLLLMVVLLAAPVMAQEDGDTAEPRLSYFVCEWGLLTIEHPPQDDLFLTITEPQNYSAVSGAAFTVRGEGAGLFEGNVIVEVRAGDEVLFLEPTVLDAEEPGGAGTWSVDIDLGEREAATPIMVEAFSTSPEDGEKVVMDVIHLHASSEVGLPFVKITRPVGNAGVSGSPLLVEGEAGAAFENNIAVEVRDFATGAVLAETFAMVATDELGGRGPFSAEVMLEVAPATPVIVTAFQPPVGADDDIIAQDTQFAVISPLARTYDRFLTIRADDPLNTSDDVCAETGVEFDNINLIPLTVNDATVLSTLSMRPLVNVSIDAAGPSVCPLPLRVRTMRTDDNTFDIELYYSTAEGEAACTRDLQPFSVRVSLGTLETPDYTVVVNGTTAE